MGHTYREDGLVVVQERSGHLQLAVELDLLVQSRGYVVRGDEPHTGIEIVHVVICELQGEGHRDTCGQVITHHELSVVIDSAYLSLHVECRGGLAYMTVGNGTIELAGIAGRYASSKVEDGMVIDGDIQLESEGGILRIQLGTWESLLDGFVRQYLEVTHLEVLEIKTALVGIDLLGYVMALGRIDA